MSAPSESYEVRTGRGAVVRTFDQPHKAQGWADEHQEAYGGALTVWVVELIRRERQLGASPAPGVTNLASRRRHR